MAQDSASSIIFLIVTLTIAAAVGGMVMRYSQEISGSVQGRGSDLSRQIETDFNIVNDPNYMYQEIDGENRLVVYAKNTGSRTIEPDERVIDVFISGAFVRSGDIDNMEVLENEDAWVPSSVLKIVIDYDLDPGDYELKLEAFNNSDSLKFRVEGS